LAFAGVEQSRLRALEVGAGTGKATAAIAARGVDVLALEPDPAMAAVAERNCRSFPGVRIEQTTFEAWPPPADRYGLVFAAQAWHWVDPEVRWAKAAAVLAPAGALALFWHRTDWDNEPLLGELVEIYRRAAPRLHAEDPGFPLGVTQADDALADELRGSGLFTDIVCQAHRWPATFTADEFVELLLTQSNHRLSPAAERALLCDAIRNLIAERDGRVTVPHATVLVTARTLGSA
jgi:SAM-dependent methyltransferase